jgi:hypothetical protein
LLATRYFYQSLKSCKMIDYSCYVNALAIEARVTIAGAVIYLVTAKPKYYFDKRDAFLGGVPADE